MFIYLNSILKIWHNLACWKLEPNFALCSINSCFYQSTNKHDNNTLLKDNELLVDKHEAQNVSLYMYLLKRFAVADFFF